MDLPMASNSQQWQNIFLAADLDKDGMVSESEWITF